LFLGELTLKSMGHAFMQFAGNGTKISLSASPVQEGPKRSTLSYANGKRPWQLFEQVFYDQLGLRSKCNFTAPLVWRKVAQLRIPVG
jgi:hypothetical protein